MNRLKVLLLAVVAMVMMPKAVKAENFDAAKSHFYVSAYAGYSVGSGDFDANFWKFGVSGGYKWFAYKGLFIAPEFGVFDQNFDNDYNLGINNNFVGFNLNANIGYMISRSALGLEVFTGPSGDLSFASDEDWVRGVNWKFGVGVNPGRFSVRLSYELPISDNVRRSGSYRVPNTDIIAGGLTVDTKSKGNLSLSLSYSF